jgi:hypothetical protein
MLFILSLFFVPLWAQSFRVFLEYNSGDCSGDPVKFVSEKDPSPCAGSPCASIGGSGSRVGTCVTTPTAVPPNTLYCSTCNYCQKSYFESDQCPTVTPDAVTIVSLGTCNPWVGGAYVKYPISCELDGSPTVESGIYYTDSACTIQLTNTGGTTGTGTTVFETLPPTAKCVPGQVHCDNGGVGNSISGQCNYAGTTSSSTTPSATGSRLSVMGASLSCLVLLVFVLLA